jgi:hypothetical protein
MASREPVRRQRPHRKAFHQLYESPAQIPEQVPATDGDVYRG